MELTEDVLFCSVLFEFGSGPTDFCFVPGLPSFVKSAFLTRDIFPFFERLSLQLGFFISCQLHGLFSEDIFWLFSTHLFWTVTLEKPLGFLSLETMEKTVC